MARPDRAWQLWRKRDQTQHKCALLLAGTVSPQRSLIRGRSVFAFPHYFTAFSTGELFVDRMAKPREKLVRPKRSLGDPGGIPEIRQLVVGQEFAHDS